MKIDRMKLIQFFISGFLEVFFLNQLHIIIFFWITKWGSFWWLQIGAKRLQIGARGITNRGRDYKSGQGLQIGAEQFAVH